MDDSVRSSVIDTIYTPSFLKYSLMASVPLSFLVYKTHNKPLRYISAIGVFAGAISIPLLGGREQFPVNSSSTMMNAVLAFIIPFQAASMLCWRDTAECTAISTNQNSPSLWSQFVSWCKEFTHVLIPIVKVPEIKRKTGLELGMYVTENLASFLIKSIAGPLLFWKMYSIATAEPFASALPDRKIVEAAPQYFSLLSFWILSIPMGTAYEDFMRGMISLFTLGAYDIQSFNDYPILSTTIAEMWGRRYNKKISDYLRTNVFSPAVKNNISKATASFLAFTVSGVLHSYVAYVTFRRGLGSSFAFFIVHAGAVSTEIYLYKHHKNIMNKIPTIIKPIGVLGFFYLTLPLYGGLFIEAMPGMLKNDPPSIQWAIKAAKAVATAIDWPVGPTK